MDGLQWLPALLEMKMSVYFFSWHPLGDLWGFCQEFWHSLEIFGLSGGPISKWSHLRAMKRYCGNVRVKPYFNAQWGVGGVKFSPVPPAPQMCALGWQGSRPFGDFPWSKVHCKFMAFRAIYLVVDRATIVKGNKNIAFKSFYNNIYNEWKMQ